MAGVSIAYDGGELLLDATPSQKHLREVEVTEHPVESGGAVTDHVRQRPRTLQIEGMFVDAATWSALGRLMDAATLLTVTTTLETYESMVLASLAAPRDAATGDALRFTATFRQIVLVESQRVTIRLPKAKANRGKQPTSPTGAETAGKVAEVRRTSLLLRGIRRGGDAFATTVRAVAGGI